MKLLLTQFLKHIVSLLPNPALHEPCRYETLPRGGPVKSLCLAYKLLCTIAPHCRISTDHTFIREVSLGHTPTCTGSWWSWLPELGGCCYRGFSAVVCPPASSGESSEGGRHCRATAVSVVLTVNSDSRFCGPKLQRALLGMGALLKKKAVSGIGGEDIKGCLIHH